MSDKKEYTQLLIILESISGIRARVNKLVKLGNESEDPIIRELTKRMIVALKGGAPDNLAAFVVQLEAQRTTTIDQGNLIKTYRQVEAACRAATASVVPQWQITARAAGWTPPAG